MMGGFGGCCGMGWFGGVGGYGWVGVILNVLLVVALIVLAVWIARKAFQSSSFDTSSRYQRGSQETPSEILAARYARGEIGRDEYKEMLADLK